MADKENTKKRTYEENLALALERGNGKQSTLPLFPPVEAVTTDRRPTKAKPVKAVKVAKPLAAVIPPKPNTKSLTQREERLLDVSAKIAGERPDDEDRAYIHSIMCQVGLPRSKVDGNSFERQSGGVGLLVEAGKLWDGTQFVQQPIPYGTMPRLMLAWMNTYAVRFNTPEIPIGDSASDFLKLLGKDVTGGKNGTFTTFKKQVQALSACRLTLGFNSNGMAHTYEGKPIKHFDAWITGKGSQRPLWPGSVTYSQEYYETLKGHAVPIDLRAFMSLKGSALAMDIYTMLAQRLHRISGRPLILHWANLRDQFGQEYKGKNAEKDFKDAFLLQLKKVLSVYPQAKVKQVTGGLMLLASPPPIPFKG
jgi:hypothetical protein